MTKLSTFDLIYTEAYALITVNLRWEDDYYPPHLITIRPERMEIWVEEEGDYPVVYEGDFRDLVIHADPLDILKVIQLINEHVVPLEF